MASDEDVYTKRPRTPNDQYTVLTEEQIRNINKTPPKTAPGLPAVGLPREGGRYYLNRYCHVQNGGNSRGLQQTGNMLYLGDQIKPNEVTFDPNWNRGMSFVKYGPPITGERVRSHFFGEDVVRFMNIDMTRRPATNYAGRVVMDCGRPGDGYYTQRFPDRASWNRSTAKLNCTNILDTVYHRPKTSAEYDEVRRAELTARRYRNDKWPEYSEYTAGYLLKVGMPKPPTQFEKNKMHAALGQQLQAAEQARQAEFKRQGSSQEVTTQKPIVTCNLGC